MPDEIKITEKELLKNEALRKKTVDKLIEEAIADIDKFVAKYGDVLLSVIENNTTDGVIDQNAVEQTLRKLSEEAAQIMATKAATQFSAVTTAEVDYFNRLGYSDNVTADERKAVFNKFANNLSVGFSDITGENRVQLRRHVRNAIGGDLSLENLKDNLTRENDTLKSHAATTAQAALSQVSQAYSNLSAEKAGLDHFWYHGTLVDVTRQFCRLIFDRVYTKAQIKDMHNGMLDPVSENRGGYNCRHRWIAVDPNWDPRIKKKLAGELEPIDIPISADGTRKATTFYEKPLKTDSWQKKYKDANSNGRKIMDKEYAAAEALQKTGYRARLDPTVKNKKGGESDLVLSLDGADVPAEVYTPQTITRGRIYNKIIDGQSDFYVIHINGEFSDQKKLGVRLTNKYLNKESFPRVLLLHTLDGQNVAERLWEFETFKLLEGK